MALVSYMQSAGYGITYRTKYKYGFKTNRAYADRDGTARRLHYLPHFREKIARHWSDLLEGNKLKLWNRWSVTAYRGILFRWSRYPPHSLIKSRLLKHSIRGNKLTFIEPSVCDVVSFGFISSVVSFEANFPLGIIGRFSCSSISILFSSSVSLFAISSSCCNFTSRCGLSCQVLNTPMIWLFNDSIKYAFFLITRLILQGPLNTKWIFFVNLLLASDLRCSLIHTFCPILYSSTSCFSDCRLPFSAAFANFIFALSIFPILY